MENFNKFILSDNIRKALGYLGFTCPTPIQEKVLPILLREENVDLHGQAQTGTGKTLAFGIPILQKVNLQLSQTQALVIAPTRELVLQISESIHQLAKFNDNILIEPVYGGVSILPQTRSLKRGSHVVVGTPGRLNDHIRRKNLSLSGLKTLVLDEADIMLEMGFKEEIDYILQNMPKNCKIWLFSATTKPGIDEIKKNHMKDPISIRSIKTNIPASNTEQFYCIVSARDRLRALCRMIDKVTDFYGVVFCQTKILTGEIAEQLRKLGYNVVALHGDMDQNLRNKVIKKFKNRGADILVATDVAARGIDVAGLTHVINFSFPDDQESYIHRIGRTGRAGMRGVAITFVNRSELRRVEYLSRKFNTEIKAIEVPTVNEIIQVRTSKALKYFHDFCNISDFDKKNEHGKLKLSIESLSKDQLVSGVVNVLSDKFLKEYEKEKDISSDVAPSRSYRLEKSNKFCELMINVGSNDGIKKQDILKFVLSSKAIKNHQIEKVRVINKLSFVIVHSDVAMSLTKALQGKILNRHRVRIQTAKKSSF